VRVQSVNPPARSPWLAQSRYLPPLSESTSQVNRTIEAIADTGHDNNKIQPSSRGTNTNMAGLTIRAQSSVRQANMVQYGRLRFGKWSGLTFAVGVAGGRYGLSRISSS